MFEIIQFTDLWYEDVATIPVLFTYAEKIYYLQLPLYKYFHHDGTITSQIDNTKNLDIIQAWSRCIEYANKQYRDEIIYAVYRSIENFLQFRRKYQTDYLNFFFETKNIFMNNKFIKQSIKNGISSNLFDKKLIPKIIHYCWFGQNQKSEIIGTCMASWKKYLPDYELVEWNEHNCNMEENNFTSTAYKKGKWAFIADYFRFKILYEHGGIYMDTDMLLHKSLDGFLCYDAFFGIEDKSFVHAGIIGALPRNAVIEHILSAYTDASFEGIAGGTVCDITTKILQSFYALESTGQTQFLCNNIAVFAPDIFTINVYNGACVAEHLYNASWWDWSDPSGASYKFEVLKSYFANLLSTSHSGATIGRTPVADTRSMLNIYGAKVLLKQIVKIKIYERSPAWCKHLCRILYKLCLK
jgi:mannosyltransferase OCH1-like enzyme